MLQVKVQGDGYLDGSNSGWHSIGIPVTSTALRVIALLLTTSPINYIKASNYFNENMYDNPNKKLDSNDDLKIFVYLKRAQSKRVFSVGHFT